jgi:hypothetical protein
MVDDILGSNDKDVLSDIEEEEKIHNETKTKPVL